MPNIMLTDVCNLRCPYCFANEFVNKAANEISIENFKRALDFICTDPNNRRIGLIGGEPTIHSNLKKLLRIVISDERIDQATLYTNCISMDKYWDEFSHRKFGFLINCNSPKDIGEKNFERLKNNLEIMINQKYMQDRISLGVNFYKPDFDYSYILELLLKYDFKMVRFAITVPNLDSQKNTDALLYFEKFKEPIKKFFRTMLSHKIIPYYDCNKMPACFITEEDIKEFEEFIPKPIGVKEGEQVPFFSSPIENAVNNETVHCNPVVDIRHDLTAVRCFGLSEYTKVKISDFECYADLINYYRNTVDVYAGSTCSSAACADCYRNKTLKCYGGCLAFKINDIMRLRREAEKIMRQRG